MRKIPLFPLVCIASAVFVPGRATAAGGTPVAAGDLDLDAVVSAHADAVGLIHAIDVTIDFEGENRPDPRAVKSPLTFSWRWSKEGERERIRVRTDYFPPDAAGRPTNLTDMFQDGRERKVLSNYDPKNPQKISPLQQRTLGAFVEPQTLTRPKHSPDPSPYLGLRVQFNDQDIQHRLSSLEKDYPKVTLVGKIPRGNHFVWRIRAEPPGGEGKNFMEVDLDPAKNFHIRRVMAHNGSYKVTGGGDMPFDSVREVTEFHDRGNGLFVPSKFEEISHFLKEGSSAILRGTITLNALNTAMPADAFDFKFPKYASVRHLPPVGRKVTVDIWGDDGPILTANNKEAIIAFARARGLETSGPSSSLDYGQLSLIGLLLVAATVVIVRGLRRKATS